MHSKSKNPKETNKNLGNDSDDIESCQEKNQREISFSVKISKTLPQLVSLFQEVSQTSINSVKRIVSISHNPKFCLLFGIGLGASSGVIALGYGIYQLESGITEPVEEVLTYAPPKTLIIKSSDGIVLKELGPVTHEKLKIWQIPDLVIQAFIDSEDHRFKNHLGFDIHGV
ncbi:MAG: penicillin-binding protein, partial [cyanobacterium endosymbiont of Rhopalodia yunnanensis]